MSEDNNKGNAVQDVITTLKTNPKAMYAAVGAVLVVGIAIMMSGGSEVTEVKTANVSAGQTVTLENPNGGNSQLTARPGLMSASDAEEDQEQNVCLAPGGSKANVEDEQRDPSGLAFVKVKVLDGACQGKSGWTSKINVKAG